MRILILFTLLAGATYADSCTAKTGGSAGSPLPWSSPANWTGCSTGGSHYPGQNGSVDTVVIPSGSNITADVTVTVGNSGQPFYSYPYLTGNGGSGFVTNGLSGCGGSLAVNGSAAHRNAALYCLVRNGALQVYLYDHGQYKTGAPALGTLSASAAPSYRTGSATNSNPVTLGIYNTQGGDVNSAATGWLPGSQQAIKISGLTGNWAALNGARTLTVTSDDQKAGSVVAISGIDSTSWGPVTGTVSLASPLPAYNAEPGSPAWALAMMAGGGTPAIQVNHVNANSGTLTLAQGITLTIRGDLLVNATYPETTAFLIQQRGAHLIADNSQYAGSPAPEYGITAGIGNNTSSLYDATDCANGTTAGTDLGAHVGECWISLPGGIAGVTLNWNNVFVNAGGVDVPSAAIGANNSNNRGMTVYHSWFDQSGPLSNAGEAGEHAGLIDIQGIRYTRTPGNTSIILSLTGTTGGPRQLQGSYFDKPVGIPLASYAYQFSGTLTNNFLGDGVWYNTATAGYGFTDNIVRTAVWPTPTGVNSFAGLHHNVLWQDYDKALNLRWIGCNGPSTGWIAHLTGYHWGDPGEVGCGISYSALLPDATGWTGSRIESIVAGYTLTAPFNHNTSAAGSAGDGIFVTNENGNIGGHPFTMQSNLAWLPGWANHPDSPGDNTYFKVATVLTPGQLDPCLTSSATVSTCDYNSAYQATQLQTVAHGRQCGADGTTCANQGRSYGGNWSFTPGSHDLDVPAYLVDDMRNLLWYDLGRGAALAPAWQNGTSYHFGDTVSGLYRDASISWVYYGGKKFNYVCRVSDCTNAPEPGRVDLWNTWREYWVFGGQWQIMQDLWTSQNQATFTDTSNYGHFTVGTGHSPCSAGTPCTAIQNAMGWILAGLRPRNPALHNAGHDGSDIGVVPVAPMCPPSGLGAIKGAIGQGCNSVMQ